MLGVANQSLLGSIFFWGGGIRVCFPALALPTVPRLEELGSESARAGESRNPGFLLERWGGARGGRWAQPHAQVLGAWWLWPRGHRPVIFVLLFV